MPVKVRCSGCEKVLNAPDKFRGKTVKCPKCKTPIKIPAPQKQKARKEADPFSDDFLADLDLTKAEDSSQSICPRCGSTVGEDDIDCPSCGASLMAGAAVAAPGGKSPIKRKKKGPNKSLFFKNTWSDAWAFLKKNKGYAIRTSLYVLILNTMFFGCVFMYNWCINPPPQAFWALLMFVFYMAPIGWVWHFVTETIKASLAKQTKLKRVNFDFFACVAYGIKFFAWQIVCGFPILLLVGIVGGMLFNNGALIPAAVVSGIGSLLIYSLLPVAMTHMAMPQQLPGWNPLKVLPGWAKSIGAIAYWILILLLTSLPVTGSLGAVGATSANKIDSFYRTMARNNAFQLQQQQAEENDDVQPPEGELQNLPWSNLAIPSVLLAVACLLSGPVVVFNARIIGQIAYYYGPEMDLNALEKQLTYKSKPKPGEEGYRKINREGLPTVAKGLNFILTSIMIQVGLHFAAVGLRFFETPDIVETILGWISLGSGGLFLLGVLFCFATPGEAKARGFLFMSLVSPIIAILLVVTVLVGVVEIQNVEALVTTALVVLGGIVVSTILTVVGFMLYLKRVSEYLYYYGGAAAADEILMWYAAYIGLLVLMVVMLIFVPILGLIGSLVGIFALIGLEIKMVVGLMNLLSGLKDECQK